MRILKKKMGNEIERRVNMKKLYLTVEEIKDHLIGTFDEEGLITKVEKNIDDIKELKKSNKNIVRLFITNFITFLGLIVTLIKK